MKVVKFGGSSLANALQIKKAVDIILEDKDRHIIVVSAPGIVNKDDVKITNLLIYMANAKLCGENYKKYLDIILERFTNIIKDLELDKKLIEEIKDNINERIESDSSIDIKFLDGIKAIGEDINARIIASYINTLGVKAKYINPKEAGLLLTEDFGNANVLEESYKNLSKLKEEESIIIFPGFFGYTKKGDIVTFPRGGSDITGSILAKAINASLYENFTDVDGVFAANPNIIESPKLIEEFTYQEMRELSYGGFNVLHAESLQPVHDANIPVHILNTNNRQAKGTRIVAKRDVEKDKIVGVAGDIGFSCIFVSKYLMNREIGFGRKLLEIIEKEGISYHHSPSGIDNISVIVRSAQLNEDIEKRLCKKIKEELNVDTVEFIHNLALIMLVGEGMHDTVGISSRAMKTIEKLNINIEMLNQSINEVSIVIAVENNNFNKAIKEIYNEFF